MTTPAKKHGGARRGAGRKPVGSVMVAVSISLDMIKSIDKWRARYSGVSRPDAVRRLVSAALDQAREVEATISSHQKEVRDE